MNCDYDRAISDATEAIRLNPNHVFSLHTRAEAFRMKGNYDRAIADATEAIKIKPTYALAYGTRGIVYLLKGDLPCAIADLIEAVRLNPGSTWAKAQLESALAEQKRKNDKQQQLSHPVAIGGTSVSDPSKSLSGKPVYP